MSDNQKAYFAGAVGAVAGLVIGLVVAPSGPDIAEIEAVVSQRVDALETARAADMEALMSAQTALSERLDAVAAQAEASTQSVSQMADEIGAQVAGISDEVGSRVAGISDEIGNRVSGLGDSVSSALEEASAAQSSAIASVLARLRSGDSATPAPEAAPEAGQSGSGESADTTAAPVSGNRVGETVSLAEDRIRAFVSRIDGEARRARLLINGETAELGDGEQLDFSAAGTDCRLQVLGIGNGQVALDGNCGDALPDPEGLTPGATASLADGAVRVFVSAIDEEAGTARLAVNGLTTSRTAIGETLDVPTDSGPCAVTVTGIDRGHVTLIATCGG